MIHPSIHPSIPQSKRAATKTIDDSQALNLGPKAAEGEYVFGVAHIFASFNDTFVVRAPRPCLILCCPYPVHRMSALASVC